MVAFGNRYSRSLFNCPIGQPYPRHSRTSGAPARHHLRRGPRRRHHRRPPGSHPRAVGALPPLPEPSAPTPPALRRDLCPPQRRPPVRSLSPTPPPAVLPQTTSSLLPSAPLPSVPKHCHIDAVPTPPRVASLLRSSLRLLCTLGFLRLVRRVLYYAIELTGDLYDGSAWLEVATAHCVGRSSEGFGSDILVKEAVSSFLVIMEPKHSAEMSKHLDKQNHALMETYRAMSHELHKLQVEEETIMRKLYELMSAEGLLPKRKKERQPEKAGDSTQENGEREP